MKDITIKLGTIIEDYLNKNNLTYTQMEHILLSILLGWNSELLKIEREQYEYRNKK
jgi:hypothetical protein